jgi:hypothetical protein
MFTRDAAVIEPTNKAFVFDFGFWIVDFGFVLSKIQNLKSKIPSSPAAASTSSAGKAGTM